MDSRLKEPDEAVDLARSAAAGWAAAYGVSFTERLDPEGQCLLIRVSCDKDSDTRFLNQKLLRNGAWETMRSTEAIGFDWPYSLDRHSAWTLVASRLFGASNGATNRYAIREIRTEVSVPGYSLEKTYVHCFPRFDFDSLEEFAVKLSALGAGRDR